MWCELMSWSKISYRTSGGIRVRRKDVDVWQGIWASPATFDAFAILKFELSTLVCVKLGGFSSLVLKGSRSVFANSQIVAWL